ncbi:hypothetical protein HYDPIDRAFT_27332 [Hydnomerulius pinastri MD-312]|nr:hypothetical protein HYDPIDRAFT_27332 [Hydnomerulius pinastri MD-312]
MATSVDVQFTDCLLLPPGAPQPSSMVFRHCSAPVAPSPESEPSAMHSCASNTDGDYGYPRTSLKSGLWTGTPIRAIIPLPHRRLRGLAIPPITVRDASPSLGPVPTVGRVDLAEMESEGDDCPETSGVANTRQVDYYQSITATEGLSSWSFEELRVECYAQSLVATGNTPCPVSQLKHAIPPAFVPRAVCR